MGVSAGSQILTDSDFSSGMDDHWYLGSNSTCCAESYAGSRYVVSASANLGQPAYTVSTYADGAVSARFSMSGTGVAGVIARVTFSAPSTYSMYQLTASSNGQACLWKEVDGKFNQLYCQVLVGWIVPAGDNVLTLQVVGSILTAVVNDRVFFNYTDMQPLSAGNWGVLVAAADNSTTTGQFAHITLYEAP
jgi:hypothetical protein